MREILFRGREKDSRTWVYGDLLHGKQEINRNKIYIHNGDPIEVNAKTVGQYTGMKDKNDVKIFEGDIVRRHEEPFKLDNIGIVVYDEVTGSFRLNVEKYGTTRGYPFVSTDTYNDGYCTVECKATFEVIGNKFDNPELLEGGDK